LLMRQTPEGTRANWKNFNRKPEEWRKVTTKKVGGKNVCRDGPRPSSIKAPKKEPGRMKSSVEKKTEAERQRKKKSPSLKKKLLSGERLKKEKKTMGGRKKRSKEYRELY